MNESHMNESHMNGPKSSQATRQCEKISLSLDTFEKQCPIFMNRIWLSPIWMSHVAGNTRMREDHSVSGHRRGRCASLRSRRSRWGRYVTWLIHMRDMTHLSDCVIRRCNMEEKGSVVCVRWLILRLIVASTFARGRGCVSRSYMWCDLFFVWLWRLPLLAEGDL